MAQVQTATTVINVESKPVGNGGLKTGWKATKDAAGDTYYFNSISGETTWDKGLVSL